MWDRGYSQGNLPTAQIPLEPRVIKGKTKPKGGLGLETEL